MCLAQGHKAVTPLRLKPTAPRSRVKHSTTEPLRSLFILIDYPIHIDTISMRLSILYFEGSQNDVFLSLKSFVIANSADPDDSNVAFHLGLHCLPKYLFTGIQNEKG